MKTIIRITTLLLLAMTATHVNAQLCSGNNTVVTAINSLGLSNPSYSMNPGGITSPTPAFTVSPASSVVYTLYTTGTNGISQIVTTTNTVAVSVYNSPTFSVISMQSANAFTLGCSTKSVTDLNIVNAQTNPPGGAISYTILPPGYTGGNSYTTNIITSYTVNVPGTYTIIVRDNVNLCEASFPVAVAQNILAPNIAASSITRTLSCNVPSVVLLGSSSTPNVTYLWKKNSTPPTIPNVSLTVNTTTAGASVPSATVIDNFTLMVQDQGNLCTSNTVITMYQNTRPPNAIIAGPNPTGPCQPTINLTNNSTSGILPNTFFVNQVVSAVLWQGPSPQPTLGLGTTYMAQTPGIYTMTIMDMNNGCTDTGTYNITGSMIKPTAAFVHTITGAQAVFNDASTGTYVNSSFYWDFGDGSFSTLQNPTHTYLNGGAHLVKFKAANPGVICADSVIQSVNVSGVPCTANSGFSMVPTATAQVWNVIPSYPWNVTAATWSWGDGLFSNTLYTAHQYSAAGMYNVCLSVTVSCAATSSTCTLSNVYRVSQVSEEDLIIQINVIAPELVSGLASIDLGGDFSWDLAPNPNAGEFNLNLKNAQAEAMRVVISDLTGRVVHDQSIEPGSNSVAVYADGLTPGMYLVTLEGGGVKATKRVVINH